MVQLDQQALQEMPVRPEVLDQRVQQGHKALLVRQDLREELEVWVPLDQLALPEGQVV